MPTPQFQRALISERASFKVALLVDKCRTKTKNGPFSWFRPGSSKVDFLLQGLSYYSAVSRVIWDVVIPSAFGGVRNPDPSIVLGPRFGGDDKYQLSRDRALTLGLHFILIGGSFRTRILPNLNFAKVQVERAGG